ncbi:pilus assembly protein PilY, partial [Pseudomonas aeruginosa]|nr:pilus assembly protein PilY [Pseudomonas aeruginosa]
KRQIYIHRQMSEQELAEMIQKEKPLQAGEEQSR